MPVSGSFSNFATRFVSPSLGFTLGWCYWMSWTLTIPSELIAAAVILEWWTHAVPSWAWALILIVPIFAIQLIHVRVFGESEAWFALIKVLLVVLFIFFGLLYDWGAFDKIAPVPGPGLANFKDGQAFVGGFSMFAQTFAWAFFSYGGIELVTLAAGESAQPEKSVPKAVKSTFFRILVFYILTVLTIGLCINHADDTLLTAAFGMSRRSARLVKCLLSNIGIVSSRWRRERVPDHGYVPTDGLRSGGARCKRSAAHGSSQRDQLMFLCEFAYAHGAREARTRSSRIC